MMRELSGTGKALLKQLEATGRFLFHGTGQPIERFEPRQATNYLDGAHVDDDAPGVHASPLADIAIFMGLIHRGNCPAGSYCRYEFADGEVHFEASQKTLDQLHHAQGREIRGYVYVFDKARFKPRDEIESICYEPIEAEQCIQVGLADLPERIGLIKT